MALDNGNQETAKLCYKEAIRCMSHKKTGFNKQTKLILRFVQVQNRKNKFDLNLIYSGFNNYDPGFLFYKAYDYDISYK